jgi:hypothetical protein
MEKKIYIYIYQADTISECNTNKLKMHIGHSNLAKRLEQKSKLKVRTSGKETRKMSSKSSPN